MNCWLPDFSHLYIESAAREYPLTEALMRRFRRAQHVWINDYRDVFTRNRQSFQLQKRSMKLILAVKKNHMLYAGSNNAQDFGYPNFHYTALILNCLYNCDYCYLQGMFPSANIVLFVNIEDFFDATRKSVEHRADPDTPLFLALSYDTDLPVFESLTNYCRLWIEFSRQMPNLIVEIRTKSANYAAFRKLTPHPRAILAWSLSPDEVTAAYEKLTPPLERRIQAAAKAQDDGWSVRLCFDPVLRIRDWRQAYSRCVETTFKHLDPDRVRDVSVGVFRMNREYFKRIKNSRDDSDILFYPYKSNENVVTHSTGERREMMGFMTKLIERYIEKERISIWT